MSEVTILNDGIRCQPCPDCLACGDRGRLLHSNLRDMLFGAPGIWNVRHCSAAGCGFAWLDPMPHPDDIGRFYETYYTHVPIVTSVGTLPAKRPVRQLAKRALARLLPRRRLQFETELLHFGSMRPGRMLEVGCGPGRFLAQASAAGWQVLGIDFDASAVAQSRRIPGVNARVMDIYDPSLDSERFDGIAMDNVIEHLTEPARVFARCRDLLAPGGRLVMVTPNIDSQCHEAFGSNWRGLEVPRHIYLYGANALRRFAEAAGLVDPQIFCRSYGSQIDFMADASEDIARRSGQQPTMVNRRRLKVRNAIMALFGRHAGEWITLVAHA